MSNSISAAKRRRAGTLTNTPIIPGNPNSTAQIEQNVSDVKKPMTIQQVIGVLDKRLLYLETYTKTQMNKEPNVEKPKESSAPVNMDEITSIVQNMIGEHFSEFNHRYEMLAEEIINMKQIVMKLQSYTMDVNKTLHEERIRLLSEVCIEETILKQIYVDDAVNLDDKIETIDDEPATEFIEEQSVVEEQSVDDEQPLDHELANESVEMNSTNTENTTETKKSRKSRQKKVIQAIWSDEPNIESAV